VTIAGKPSDKLAPGKKKQYPKTGRVEMSRYLVIIEQTSTGFPAYSPDLPGCVATRATREELEKQMHDAIEIILEGLRLRGEPIAAARLEATYCEVA
jgi:predicted RNase H-like HicB family nuclease